MAKSTPSDQAGDSAFFGHPKGLGVLAATELWERFSFYGMQALLMLYMVKVLLTPEVAPGVLGLAAFRSVLSELFGPMSDLAFAAQVFGLYSGLVLVTPLVGAWLGDRVLGRTKTVAIGALLMTAGHLAMTSEAAFLIALLLLILGAGCVTGNLQAQIGNLYQPDDARLTRAFGIYLMVLNTGALAAPLIAGTLGERVGFHWGFGAAGVGMFVGLIIYLRGLRHLPADILISRQDVPRLNRAQWITVGALLITLLPQIFAGAALNQAYGIMIIWAETAVDRQILGFDMPVTWILILDGIFAILGVIWANRLWARWAEAGREPDDLVKMGIGSVMLVVGYVLIGLLAKLPSVPLLGWIAFFLIIDFSVAWTRPPGQALISRYAPASIRGMMFAISGVAQAFGFFLLGYLGRFYEPLGPSLYFLTTAALPVGGAVALIVFNRKILYLLETTERHALATAANKRSAA
ncbi:MAG: oligopeptide:H+ symporter [Congregibacter sp.]|nr:oligopeptide:H+ symporter [Congregibacter sp.]